VPSESDLRRSLRDGDVPSGEIDLAAVLRRSRARRRPRVILVGAASVLAVAAIVVPVSVSALTTGSSAGSSALAGEAPSVESATGSAGGVADSTAADPLKRGPADKLNLCAGPLAEVAPAPSGLVLTIAPVDAAATATAIPVVVTLTNTGPATVTGSTSAAPAITLSQNGITLWHTNGAVDSIGMVVDLAPGASMTYATTFEPVICGIDDDAADLFRSDLPAVAPGTYAVSAALDVSLDTEATTPDASLELVTGPLAVVTLH
jgi:hypothetical protein